MPIISTRGAASFYGFVGRGFNTLPDFPNTPGTMGLFAQGTGGATGTMVFRRYQWATGSVWPGTSMGTNLSRNGAATSNGELAIFYSINALPFCKYVFASDVVSNVTGYTTPTGASTTGFGNIAFGWMIIGDGADVRTRRMTYSSNALAVTANLTAAVGATRSVSAPTYGLISVNTGSNTLRYADGVVANSTAFGTAINDGGACGNLSIGVFVATQGNSVIYTYAGSTVASGSSLSTISRGSAAGCSDYGLFQYGTGTANTSKYDYASSTVSVGTQFDIAGGLSDAACNNGITGINL
jgi:hypothetical protein